MKTDDRKRTTLDLMQLFEGYVRNYRKINLNSMHNRTMFTKREIDYFASLGEMLGFESFVEDAKPDLERGRSRPMDLAWWKYDARVDEANYIELVLHLERENVWSKDEDTIEKLFSKTEEGYLPQHVIGIQNVGDADRIDTLNDLILQKNEVQASDVLMVYRYVGDEGVERVLGCRFDGDGLVESREALCKQDEMGYWYMGFVEEMRK
ncbi:hypothetical protein LCM20_09565 [Halobacillus litoralis]|uniref:hypothetical protein n=1 Tax=Halobacillus litoralis TaxID=45668 RepID=UPI001CD20D29|nr:hypothetical protein [Halobacillus litoralis]MCA0970837.1 hypothetical protein [Halobacillus litoralis]